MLKVRGAAAFALLVSFVSLGAIGPLCAAERAPMACCKSASPCSTGIGTRPDCCRIDPAPATREPLSLQRSFAPGWRLDLSRALIDAIPVTVPSAADAVLGTLSEIALAHHPPVPLFLLHASILR